MEEMGITSIAAHSSQAKGRVERLWGTFQDRLVSELRLAGATIRRPTGCYGTFCPGSTYASRTGGTGGSVYAKRVRDSCLKNCSASSTDARY